MKGRPLLKLIEALQGALEEVKGRVSYLLRRGDGEKECMHETTSFRAEPGLTFVFAYFFVILLYFLMKI